MRTLPLLLVISTTLFHLASANGCGRAIYGGAGQNFGTGTVVNIDSTFTGGTITMGGDCAVFISSCNADHVEVSSSDDHLFKIYRDTNDISKVESLGNQDGKYEISSGRCNNYYGPTKQKPRCGLDIIVHDKSSGNYVQVEFPEGVIRTRGMRLAVKVVCTARPSMLICLAGSCEWTGDTGNEGGSPVETEEDAPVKVVDSVGSSHSGNVWGSPCNADRIHVTNDAGGYSFIPSPFHPEIPDVEVLTGMEHTAGRCEASDRMIGPGKLLDKCPDRFLDLEKGGLLRIFRKHGIITSRGAGIRATARCNGMESVVCKDGKCTGPGVSGGDGSSDETEGSTVEPKKPIRPSKPPVISGNDDKSEEDLAAVTVVDSVGSSHSGNVWDSPCNADQIRVTNDAGGVSLISPDGGVESNHRWLSHTAGECSASDFVIGPVNSSLSECPLRIGDDEKGGLLRIFLKHGIITSNGTGIMATARCNGTESVVCKEGKCTGPGVGEGSSDEEDSTVDPKKLPFKPIPPEVITGNDVKPESGSNQTTTESTTEADEKTSTTLIIVFVLVGVLALAGFGAFLVCILKNRSSIVDEADVEEGDADTKTDVISDVTSEQ